MCTPREDLWTHYAEAEAGYLAEDTGGDRLGWSTHCVRTEHLLCHARQLGFPGEQGAQPCSMHLSRVQRPMGKFISLSRERRGGSHLVTEPMPSSSSFAGLQERLGTRYKATVGLAFHISRLSELGLAFHISCLSELSPMLFLASLPCVLVGMSAAGRTRGLTGAVSISGPALAWLTHNACVGCDA